MTYNFSQEDWQTNQDQSEYYLQLHIDKPQEKPIIQMYQYSSESTENVYNLVNPKGIVVIEAADTILSVIGFQPIKGFIVIK